jgi:drug/metabolite transporter (DMT)-like permease
MLTPTLLALGAAVLHAGWNLAVKQSGDRFIALWAQFGIAGTVALVGLLSFGHLPAQGWIWAGLSGLAHVPYTVMLAKAYDLGDFSLVYPIARGGGAAGAAVFGVVLLHDEIGWLTAVAIAIIITGLVLLAGRAPLPALFAALAVAATIAAYSTIDAQGSRVSGTRWYAAATHVGTAVGLSVWGTWHRRWPDLRVRLRTAWGMSTVMGLASLATYGMVVVAFQYAPVGYVTALRESSVLIVSLVGWLKLKESAGTQRLFAAAVMVAGIVVLVISH